MVPQYGGGRLMRVGFTLIGGGKGTGGYNYLLNLLRVVSAHQAARLTPVLFLGTDIDEATARPLAEAIGLEIVRSSAFDRARKTRSLAASAIVGADLAVRRQFEQARIDVLFESAQFHGWRLGIPVIAWIPDFQHRVLPHMFTRRGYWKRELGFRAQMASGRAIMLSSDDARLACERFYPQTVGRTRTVRFAVPPAGLPSLAESREVARSHGLPERFFFMPNQLSKHKNHLLVIEALALLRARGQVVCVAASGKQEDERHPEHFPEVQRRIEASGIGGSLRLLGLIPYAHLASLMRASTALLNPSLFEGWSTPVEEARSIGVPLVLSDLAVHREQAGSRALYFDRHSAASLADALAACKPVPDDDAEARGAEARVEVFAAQFAQLAEDCAAGRIGR